MAAVAKMADVGGGAYPTTGKMRFIVPALHAQAVPIGKVKLDPNNPRRNDDAAVRLAEVIRANGFRVPIVTDKTGMVRAGNTRLKAMRLLGAESIPAIQQEFLSKEAAVAFGLSDNKSAEWAQWDDEVLARLLSTPAMRGYAAASFTQREIGAISLRGSVQAGWNWREFIGRYTKATSIAMLNMGQVVDGRLHMTDIDSHVVLPFLSDDGFASLAALKRGAPFADAKVDAIEDFPSVPDLGKSPVRVDAPWLADAGRFALSMAVEPTRGLDNLFIDGAARIAFATDGTIGSYVRIPTFDGKLAVPLAYLTEIVKACAGVGKPFFDFGDGWVRFCDVLYVKLREQEPPALSKVLPANPETSPVDTGMLLQAIRTLTPFWSAKATKLVSVTKDGVCCDGKLVACKTGTALTKAYNAASLSDVLGKVRSGVANVHWGKSAIDIAVVDDAFLIMPLRLDTGNAEDVNEPVLFDYAQKERDAVEECRVIIDQTGMVVTVRCGVGVSVDKAVRGILPEGRTTKDGWTWLGKKVTGKLVA